MTCARTTLRGSGIVDRVSVSTGKKLVTDISVRLTPRPSKPGCRTGAISHLSGQLDIGIGSFTLKLQQTTTTDNNILSLIKSFRNFY